MSDFSVLCLAGFVLAYVTAWSVVQIRTARMIRKARQSRDDWRRMAQRIAVLRAKMRNVRSRKSA